MKFKYTKAFLFLFVLCSAFFARAQEISNIRVTQTGNTVNILYNLSGDGQVFKVDLYYTVDDGQTWKGPLNVVSGDVGESVLPGNNKRMSWNVLSEPGLEEGYLQFKVLAETTELPNPIQTGKQMSDVKISKYKTGKAISLTLALASVGTGVYTYLQGNKLYDEYKTATDDAADLRSKVETYDVIYPIAFAVAGASTVSFIIHAAKHSKAKKELSFQPVPLHNGGGLAVSYRF